MPRVAKTKAAPAAGPKKKTKLYNKPEKIKEGTILRDLTKTEWKIGPSIGTGGFGDIYTACKVGQKNYDYVMKCEPHDNGPLFVEMHFYMRNAKLEDIVAYKNNNGVRSLGIPHMLGNGSTEINGVRHRFLILPRFATDINKFYLDNGKRLPEGTVYRIALQMIEAYKFVHGCGYVHADLKAANILLGTGTGGASQVYLVDFGLAAHYTTKAFKPDPKKMHNGTVEYTSRDAHMGVATMRGDMEILGYNIIDWLGTELPWIKGNVLANPANVQKLKDDFMENVEKHLAILFPRGVPTPVLEYMKYVAKMEYNDTPDYVKCRKIFSNALKVLKVPNTGELVFKLTNDEKPSTSKAAKSSGRSKIKQDEANGDDDVVVINASDDDDGDVIFEKKNRKILNHKTRGVTNSSPARDANRSTTTKRKSSPKLNPVVSPKKSKIGVARTPSTPTGRISKKHLTPVSAKANIRVSPAVKVSASRLRGGNTIINDNITPNVKAGKTYEFNFELDVSVDANVIVNVKRKKKALPKDPPKQSALSLSNSNSNTPVTRVNVRKAGCDTSDNDSPRTPAVTVRKSKRLIQSPL